MIQTSTLKKMETLTPVPAPVETKLPEIRLIENETEYAAALETVERLWGAAPGSPERAARNVWFLLIADYERRAGYALEAPPLAYAIQEALEERGMKQADLVSEIGSKSVVSKIVKGKRRPTWEQARYLHKRLGIPTEVFLADFRNFLTS